MSASLDVVVPLGARSTRLDETAAVVVALHEVLWLVVWVVVAVLSDVLRRARIAATSSGSLSTEHDEKSKLFILPFY